MFFFLIWCYTLQEALCNISSFITWILKDNVAKKYANYVTKRSGGDRAVAEACLHVLKKFFKPFNPNKLPEGKKFSGEWTV